VFREKELPRCSFRWLKLGYDGQTCLERMVVATNKVLRTKCAINLQDSDPDLLVRGTDPWIWIRIKKSQIHNTAYNYL
jgi:hypothetical protein